VQEIVSGGSTGDAGIDIVARLLQVDSDAGTHLVLVARDPFGDLACLAVDGPLARPLVAPDGNTAPGGRRLVTQQCINASRSLRIVAVAAAPGEGQVVLSGVDGALVLEPTERLVVVGPTGQRAPVVAALTDDPGTSVTFAPTAGP